jgi:signal peptidase I
LPVGATLNRMTPARAQQATLRSRLWRNEWFRALLLALVMLLLLHAFVLRFVTVRSTSMFATLQPGDLLLVKRWTAFTGCARGDIVVFRDPLRDVDPPWRRPLLVKRLVGLPGDTVVIRDGRLLVNGTPFKEAPGKTKSYLIRLADGADCEAFANRHGLPEALVIPGRLNLETALNEQLAAVIGQDDEVVSITPMRLATGSAPHIFPFSPRYPWNGDDFGPLILPKKGDTLRINADNLPLYDRVMSIYEGHALSNNGNQLLVDDTPLTQYVVEQDYGFVLGDSRHFSADSRYWGFLPMNSIVGSTTEPLYRQRMPAAVERRASDDAHR